MNNAIFAIITNIAILIFAFSVLYFAHSYWGFVALIFMHTISSDKEEEES